MRTFPRVAFTAAALVTVAVLTSAAQTTSSAARQTSREPSTTGQDGGFRFRSGVELINVTATVTDDDGRFVGGLRKEDFRVWDDSEPVDVSHFSNERVPVSLGIALDTSGSMTPDKMSAAREAIDRFMTLLGPDDEMFLYRFANVPELVQDWTKDRRALSRALANLHAGGGTAMYEAIADALPLAQSGHHRKKALVVISDGNDTSSSTTTRELKEMIRQSEVMVYAIGVDGRATPTYSGGAPPRLPIPIPFPIPGRRPQFPIPPPIGGGGNGTWTRAAGDGVNADALRVITDDTGGRTEVVRGFGDLDGATSRIADELSKQYYLGYASPGKTDGRWHAIRVEVKDRRLRVRARKGYVAS